MSGDEKDPLGRMTPKSVPAPQAKDDEWHADTLVERGGWRPAVEPATLPKADPVRSPTPAPPAASRWSDASTGSTKQVVEKVFRAPSPSDAGTGRRAVLAEEVFSPRKSRPRRQPSAEEVFTPRPSQPRRAPIAEEVIAPRTGGARRVAPTRKKTGRAAISQERIRVSGLDALGTAVSKPKGPPPAMSPKARAKRAIDELSKAGPGHEGPAVQKLTTIGEVALPLMAKAFPGALWFDRRQPHRRLPRGTALSGLASAFVAFGPRAAETIRPLLSHGEADVRYYAALVFAEIAAAEADAFSELLFDVDGGIRNMSLLVLERLIQENLASAEARGRLFDSLHPHVVAPGPRQVVAIRAVGVLRSDASVPHLITAIDASEGDQRSAAFKVLKVLTAQDFGAKTKKWRAWHNKAAKQARHEWLIEGLNHAKPEPRGIAIRELERLTGETFGYTPADGRSARKKAQKAFREWFAGRDE